MMALNQIDYGKFHFLYDKGMGNLSFLPEFGFLFFFIFRVENTAFSSANSSLISLLQVFFSFPVPTPDDVILQKTKS